MRDVKTIGVIGSGTMGSGIAHVAAVGGYETVMTDVTPEALHRGLEKIRTNLRKGVEKGKVTQETMDAAIDRIRTTTVFEKVKEADFVIEAAPEDLKLKIELFRKLERLTSPETVFATNTSALSISEMAGALSDPSRLIGMHFFNPVHIMKLIEIIRGKETADDVVETTREVSRRMGKETVLVHESPGFVTSRMNALIGNEAFYMLQEGVASAEDIDKALKLGLNHPMGPFEMIDLVGLDTRLSILKYLHETLGEKYRPCPLIEKLVKEGRLGRKTGRGVYTYGDARAGSSS